GWASADIGEDDCDHFFRQIIDGIYVLVQVGYIPGQIDRLLLGVVHFLSPVSIDFIVPILSTKGWYGKCRFILPSRWVTCGIFIFLSSVVHGHRTIGPIRGSPDLPVITVGERGYFLKNNY